MTYTFEVSAVIPASSNQEFDAWMSSTRHAEMTCAAAEIEPVVGGTFTAWDGYIWGVTLALEAPHCIVQS